MIAYAAADLHGNLPEVPRDADLLLLAGDICPDFPPKGRHDHWSVVDETGIGQTHWLDTTFREWLAAVPCPVVATWGNHDFVGEKHALVDALYLPWTLLVDREVTVEGLRVWGTPWVPHLPRWAFYAREEALQARAEMIPENIDILMTHGPPYKLGDRIPGGSKYGNVGAEYVGDPSLNEAIKRTQPRFVVCGHIHEAHGFYPTPDHECLVVNTAAVDEFYVLREHPFTRLLI